MELTDREKEQLKAMIDEGQPIPPRYKALLFDQPHEAELIWAGKTSEVTSVVLPFQSIEQIDEPRAGTHAGTTDLFAFDRATGRQTGGWANKLIWGDNKLVISSLKNGPLRRQIEDAGGVKLVYIDPPFDVGADFSSEIEVGHEETITKEPSVIEELAYRDTWGRGVDSYFSMINERIKLIHGLLHPEGNFFIHCDWRVSAGIRLILDEIFGKQNFRNEIFWYYYNKMPDTRKGVFPRSTDTIFWYVKDRAANYFFKPLTEKRDAPVRQLVRKKVDGRMVNARDEHGNVLYSDRDERVVDNVWRLSMLQPADKTENLRYATQKPEHLVERIIEATSREGDLVADFFCGSGTTMAVAEKMGRKWIGVDLGRFAIHTSRKRMIGVQRALQEQGKPYRSFEILNLGKYERQYFAGIDPTLPEEQRRAISLQKEEHFLTLILSAYKAERTFQVSPFHGKKSGALILVGPIDAPITQSQVHEAVEAARKLRISKIDILGFEFEMGIVPHAQDEARAKGVNVALRYIPKDVFDRRAVDKGQVVFYDVAYVEAQPIVQGMSVAVRLKDFGVYYRQDDIGALTESLKNGATKVTVDAGQVVKIVKDKDGVVGREVLTKTWSDWIDYWSVDFDFENRKEIVCVNEADGSEREAWTGSYIFENEWQSFRTRQDRQLELTSVPHEYPKKGRYKIGVKVIDIFGNDTTKVIEVSL